MRLDTFAANALLIGLLSVPFAVFSADKLSDLVDQALTQSEAIPEWAAGEKYQPGTERTAENPDALDTNGDPTIFIWQMKDAAEHTAGAIWDAAERDHWRPLGAYVAPANPTTLNPPYIEPILVGDEAGTLRKDYNSIHVVRDSMNAAVGGNGELFMHEPPTDGNGEPLDSDEIFVEADSGNTLQWTIEDVYGVQFERPDGSGRANTFALEAGTTYGIRLSAEASAWVYREILKTPLPESSESAVVGYTTGTVTATPNGSREFIWVSSSERTAAADGLYRITATGLYNSGTAGDWFFYAGRTVETFHRFRYEDVNVSRRSTVVEVMELTAGQVVSAWLWHTSAGDVVVSANITLERIR